MQKVLVTGVAGFIGSHVAEELVSSNYEVIGIDSFSSFYPREIKLLNLKQVKKRDNFSFIELDLRGIDSSILRNIDYVIHLAAQPGVRESWGKQFDSYVSNNIVATKVLLEHLRNTDVKKVVFASSSSVYGSSSQSPSREDEPSRPSSPYGITKLAAEELCRFYYNNFGVPITILRYFSVYGPRQRPDMAVHRLVKSFLDGTEFVMYGEGNQRRDFTYITDAVNCTLVALESAVPGEIFNVGSGRSIELKHVVSELENITGKVARIRHEDSIKGDVRSTCAEISKASRFLGYKPRTDFGCGLSEQMRYVGENLFLYKKMCQTSMLTASAPEVVGSLVS